MRTKRFQRQAGFSMVEIAIAILVITMGLVAIFGLFGDALDLNKKTIAETQSALFADAVLNGLRAQAEALAAQSNCPMATWIGLVNNIKLTNSYPWATNVSVNVNNTAWTPIDYLYSTASMGQITDYSYRYKFSVAQVSTNNMLGVTLGVIAGTSTNMYYTEIYNLGM